MIIESLKIVDKLYLSDDDDLSIKCGIIRYNMVVYCLK